MNMTTLIKKYYSGSFPTEQSEIFQKLLDKGCENINFDHKAIQEIYKALFDLFEGNLHQDYFIILFRPWLNTLQLIGIIDKVNVTQENRKWLEPILSSIKKIRSKITIWKNEGSTLGLYALINAQEPDLDLFLKLLGEIESVVENTSTMNFERGSQYSKDKILRFGIYALFNIAEASGLTHNKKPSVLFKFVEIITSKDPKAIGEYYQDYKNTDLLKLIRENILFEYIYNPDLIVREIKAKMPYVRKCDYQTFVLPVEFPVTK